MTTETNPFAGATPAIMTPFNADGSINFDALLDKRKRLVEAGMASMVWPGTMDNRSQLTPEESKVAMAQALYDSGEHSIKDICQTMGVSRATLYRYIKVG